MGQQAFTQADNRGVRVVDDTAEAIRTTPVDAAGAAFSPATAANQTAQSVLLGAVNETAPTTDTASSGLNGRLQRIAQRISSAITLLAGGLPAALTSAGNFKAGVQEFKGAASYANGQVTAGSVSGTLVASRATRRAITIRNQDAANSAYVGAGTVTSANGFLLKAGESIAIETAAAMNCIRDTADVALAYFETYD